MKYQLANLSSRRIFGLAVGAAAVSGAAVLVTASAAAYSVPFLSSSNTPQATTATFAPAAAQPSALCSEFLAHFAADLNTSQAAFNAAFQKAIGQTLADQVKAGKLTQARADAISKRLAGRAPCAIAPRLQPQNLLSAFRPALLSAEASALGITDTTLKADLAKGMTLSQIASAQHVTEADFRNRVIVKLKPVLDAAVTNKQITPAREQAIIKRLQTGQIPLWNKPAHKPAAEPTPIGSNG
ncbi:MAG TPA: hypothetical protein VGJ79_06910 [Candidatus Dormibacteraeota bacterium]|jgi:hypothetical protein